MILVDGDPNGHIPVTDSSVLRGDGVFESLRAMGGRPFALDEHLDRLESSASAMDLALVDRSRIVGWVEAAAADVGDGVVRVLVTRGDEDSTGRTVVVTMDLPEVPSPFTLKPHPAPWHPAGRAWELAGVKTLSYAPNVAASRAAGAAGFSDALLLAGDRTMLEGPTFSVAWFVDGVLETPSLDLGILASITRAQALDVAEGLGFEVSEGRFRLDRLGVATDLVALSTVKQVTAVARCGDVEPPRTDLTDRLRAAFLAMAQRGG